MLEVTFHANATQTAVKTVQKLRLKLSRLISGISVDSREAFCPDRPPERIETFGRVAYFFLTLRRAIVFLETSLISVELPPAVLGQIIGEERNRTPPDPLYLIRIKFHSNNLNSKNVFFLTDRIFHLITNKQNEVLKYVTKTYIYIQSIVNS